MADGFTFVEGIGDEVVLFGAFLFLSMCMLVYVSLRGSRNERPRAEPHQEDSEMTTCIPLLFMFLIQCISPGTDDTSEEEACRANTATNNEPGTTTAGSDGHSVTSDETAGATTDQNRHQSDYHGSRVQNEESVLRSRSHQTQDTRNTNDNEETLSVRLILLNNSTIPVNAQPSTTLGDIRRSESHQNFM